MNGTPKPAPRWRNRLREHRERLGLTQQQAADGAGLVLSHYQKLEAGDVCPSVALAGRLCAALGLRLSCPLEPRP